MEPSRYTAAPASAPHTLAGNSVTRIMLTVCAALLPATLFGFWLYGWPAVFVWLICVVAALAGEALCLRLAARPAQAKRSALADGSALLTGWLLAISLPPWAPWWIAAIGGLFATVIGKQVFGGIGCNLFNPAMVARVFLLISFPIPMTAWVAPLPISSAAAPSFSDGLRIVIDGLSSTASISGLDAMSSATLLGYAKTELARGVDLAQALGASGAPGVALSGARSGSLGETASLLIAAGGLLLVARRIIAWHIPLALLAGIALPAMLAHAVDGSRYLDAGSHLLSGGALLGAFFIATDYVTSPNSRLGQIVYAFACGLLTFVIRTWGGYPEGMAFAVLLMNAVTPVIDRYLRPRILGRDWRGAPLAAASQRTIEKQGAKS